LLPQETEYISFEIKQSGLGVGVICMGILCLFIGLLGWTVSNVKGIILSSIFIFFAAAMGVIFLVIGVVMAGLISSDTVNEMKSQACEQAATVKSEYLASVD